MQMSRFVKTELNSESDSGSYSEAESKSDTELMIKLKSGFNSDSEQIILLSISQFCSCFNNILNNTFYWL